MAIYNKRAKFTSEQLLDHYHKRNSITYILYTIVRVLSIVVQNLYCISSYLILSWLVLLPVSWLKSDLYSRLENYLYNSLLFIVSSWSLAAGLTVVEAGDEFKHLIEEPDEHYPEITRPDDKISAETNGSVNYNNNNISENNHTTASKISHRNGAVNYDSMDLTLSTRAMNNNDVKQETTKKIQHEPRILFLCNHISTADVPLIMQSFSTLTNQSLLWVLDAQFKITNFGVVCGSHGDFFVAKNSFADGSLREHVLKYEDRNLLVLFPEGGFLRKRIDGSNRYAIKNNLPQTSYVTHPRFGAFKDLIDPSVGVTHIVDATLMYDDIKNPLSIIDIVLGNKQEPAILHYKVYERSEINPTEEWLRNIWLEKDKLLTQYYEDRASVLKKVEDTFRVACLDWFKILSVHLFFFLVCYLTMFRLFNATSTTMLKARELYYSTI